MSEQESCTSSCGSCQEDCTEHDFSVAPHPFSSIEKVIGVVSGKGGVGKSLVTSLLAVEMQKQGHPSAILDADITGPSIPKAFGIKEMAMNNEHGILPFTTKTGIDIMSINMLLKDPTDPIIWRGPAIAGVVKQFWSEVIWSGIEYMFVDMPPGTGDVPLTVFQSLPLDGIIIVTSPQELVSMIVEKAVKMAKEMNMPILGIIENMSYLSCPDCDKKIDVFGKSNVEEVATKHGLRVLAKLPLEPSVAALCDAGKIEDFDKDWLKEATSMIKGLITKTSTVDATKNLRIAVTSDKSGNVFYSFENTKYYEFYEIKAGTVVTHSTIDTNDCSNNALDVILKKNKIDLLITGSIKNSSKTALAQAGIKFISEVEGNIEKAVNDYLADNIKEDSEDADDLGNQSGTCGPCHGCNGHVDSCN